MKFLSRSKSRKQENSRREEDNKTRFEDMKIFQMMKQGFVKAVTCVVAGVACIAMLLAAPASAMADGAETPLPPQPHVSLKIKGPKQIVEGHHYRAVKLADYINVNANNDTVDVTTVNNWAIKNGVHEALDGECGVHTDNSKPLKPVYPDVPKSYDADIMNWLVKKLNLTDPSDSSTFPYQGKLRQFLSNLDGVLDDDIHASHVVSIATADGVSDGSNMNTATATFNLPNGIYLIREVSYADENYSLRSMPILVSTKVAGLGENSKLGSSEINAKAEVPTITKVLGNGSKQGSYSVGDVLTFHLRGKVPLYGELIPPSSTFVLDVHDYLPDGLSYVKELFNPKVTVNGTPLAKNEYNFNPIYSTWDYPSGNNVCGAELDFHLQPYLEGKLNSDPPDYSLGGKDFEITYSVVMNSMAISTTDGTANTIKNKADMWYKLEAPCVWDESGRTSLDDNPDASVSVTSGSFKIRNVVPWNVRFNIYRDGDPNPIDFSCILSGKNALFFPTFPGDTGDVQPLIYANDSGNITVAGLGDGKYTVKEVRAADGSTPPSDAYFKITITHHYNDAGLLTNVSYDVTDDRYGFTNQTGNDSNVVHVRYIQSLKDVPATSPVGAGVRVLIGVMTLMCGVGIFVGTKRLMRRRNAEDSIKA